MTDKIREHLKNTTQFLQEHTEFLQELDREWDKLTQDKQLVRTQADELRDERRTFEEQKIKFKKFVDDEKNKLQEEWKQIQKMKTEIEKEKKRLKSSLLEDEADIEIKHMQRELQGENNLNLDKTIGDSETVGGVTLYMDEFRQAVGELMSGIKNLDLQVTECKRSNSPLDKANALPVLKNLKDLMNEMSRIITGHLPEAETYLNTNFTRTMTALAPAVRSSFESNFGDLENRILELKAHAKAFVEIIKIKDPPKDSVFLGRSASAVTSSSVRAPTRMKSSELSPSPSVVFRATVESQEPLSADMERKVATLVQQGYSREGSIKALQTYKGDLEASKIWLVSLSGRLPKTFQSPPKGYGYNPVHSRKQARQMSPNTQRASAGPSTRAKIDLDVDNFLNMLEDLSPTRDLEDNHTCSRSPSPEPSSRMARPKTPRKVSEQTENTKIPKKPLPEPSEFPKSPRKTLEQLESLKIPKKPEISEFPKSPRTRILPEQVEDNQKREEIAKKKEEEEKKKIVSEKWTCGKCVVVMEGGLEKCNICGENKPEWEEGDEVGMKKSKSASSISKGRRKIVSQKEAKVQLQYTKNIY